MNSKRRTPAWSAPWAWRVALVASAWALGVCAPLELAAATTFGITNMVRSGTDVLLQVGGGAGSRVYQLLASDNDGAAAGLPVRSHTNGTAAGFTFCDAGVLDNPAVTTRFYQVVEEGVGAPAITNATRWLMQKQFRRANAWHLSSIPVDYGSPARNSMSNTLGCQLAEGQRGGYSEQLAPRAWLQDGAAGTWSNLWLCSNQTWYAGSKPAGAAISPGTAFWLKMPPDPPDPPPAILLGRAHTRSAPVTFVSNRWVLFSWPFARPRFEEEGGAGRQGWELLASGGHGGMSADSGDNLYLEYRGVYYLLYLGTDGRWYIQNTRQIPRVALQAGGGYFYFARGSNFVWHALQADPFAPSGDPPPDSDDDGLLDAWEWQYFGELFRDGAGDADADGLSDREEFQRATDPTRADTDGDGMDDGTELLFGADPTRPEAWSALPFLESFEPATVQAGDVAGQHGWSASSGAAAVAQSATVARGTQALRLAPVPATALAEQRLAGHGAPVVWVDLLSRPARRESAAPPAISPAARGVFFVDAQGRLNVYDGSPAASRWVALTNHAPLDASRWERITLREDFVTRTWDLYLNETNLVRGLGFATDMREFAVLRLHGGTLADSFVDELSVQTHNPFIPPICGSVTYSGPQTGTLYVVAGLASGDWALVPGTRLAAPGAFTLYDAWKGSNQWIQAFIDSDGDGVRDGWEAAGTFAANPVMLTGTVTGVTLVLTDPDLDVDGLPDWWEAAFLGGLSQGPDDDADADGLTNGREFGLATRPDRRDTDTLRRLMSIRMNDTESDGTDAVASA